jgi:hypothetical protein
MDSGRVTALFCPCLAIVCRQSLICFVSGLNQSRNIRIPQVPRDPRYLSRARSRNGKNRDTHISSEKTATPTSHRMSYKNRDTHIS